MGRQPSADGARSRAETREAILVEATTLFGRYRYDGVALRDVAAAAGVALSTLSSHFARKEDLLEAVLKRALDIMTDRRSNLGPVPASATEALERYVARAVDLVLDASSEFKVLDNELLSRLDDPATLDLAVRVFGRPIMAEDDRRMMTLVDALGPGLPRSIPPARMVQILFATVYGVTKIAPLHYFLRDEPATADRSVVVGEILRVLYRARDDGDRST